MSESMYTLSSSPHIRSKDTVQTIMRDVIIALLPATIAAVYFFKLKALLVIITAVLSCVIAEYAWQKLTHREVTIGDLSAVVTGLLLAFNVPPTFPLWMVALGSFFSIISFSNISLNIFRRISKRLRTSFSLNSFTISNSFINVRKLLGVQSSVKDFENHLFRHGMKV